MNNIKLVQCYHCYALVDHKRPSCPFLNEPQRCPRCGQFGHNSWECQNHTVCLHCNGPHPVTAPCCPVYREKLEEHKPKLLAELLTEANTPQNFPNKNNEDALNLLITSALTANGSFINFINSLFTASLNLGQLSNPVIAYPPYSLPLTYNSDWEASSQCLSRSTSSLDSSCISEEQQNSTAISHDSTCISHDPIPNLLTPTSDPPLDSDLSLESPSRLTGIALDDSPLALSLPPLEKAPNPNHSSSHTTLSPPQSCSQPEPSDITAEINHVYTLTNCGKIIKSKELSHKINPNPLQIDYLTSSLGYLWIISDLHFELRECAAFLVISDPVQNFLAHLRIDQIEKICFSKDITSWKDRLMIITDKRGKMHLVKFKQPENIQEISQNLSLFLEDIKSLYPDYRNLPLNVGIHLNY